MKTIKILAIAMLVATTLAACGGAAKKGGGGSGETPEQVALNYTMAMNEWDYDTAAKYASKSMLSLYNNFKRSKDMLATMTAERIAENVAAVRAIPYKVVGEVTIAEDGKSAKVPLRNSDPYTSVTEICHLLLEDGDWKVDTVEKQFDGAE